MSKKVSVFFYGSYINFDVLKEVDIVPESYETAKLNGYDIQISARANLIKSDEHCVYGILTSANHSELKRLYEEHAHGILGEIYLPEAVLVETLEGKWKPTLCYIAHKMKPLPAENAYVERIVKPAKKFGFPEWYIKRLESYKRF